MTAAPQLTVIGTGFERPESVHELSDGTLVASHRGRGVREVSPSGASRVVGPTGPVGRAALLPNGIAPVTGGYLVANLAEDGGVWRIDDDGTAALWLSHVGGRRLPPANFVLVEPSGRTWVTVSTTRVPRHLAYRRDIADGFVVVVDERGARVVAEGLAYANEICIVGDALYVNETLQARTTAFDIGSHAALVRRRVVARYAKGDFPDGLAVDCQDGLWSACIVSNRLYRIDPTGSMDLVADYADQAWVAEVEDAVAHGRLDRRHFDSAPVGPVRNVSSLCFAGTDRRTILLGSLIDQRVLSLRSPVAGPPSQPRPTPTISPPDTRSAQSDQG